MFTHLLIATDGSELAAKAETTGLALAKHIGARVTVVTANDPWSAMTNGEPSAFDFPIEDYEKAAARHAEQVLARVRGAAMQLGVACETVHVVDFPAETIIETARAKGCDLIVMASHGRRGLKELMLGSQAQRVVTLSAVPVLICR
jgi:nucleotide-binding universal stress UspA family protein